MDRNEVKNKLLGIFERSVGETIPTFEESARLKEELGLDSIDFVAMAIEVQTEFGIELQTEELVNIVTVKDLIDMVATKNARCKNRAA